MTMLAAKTPSQAEPIQVVSMPRVTWRTAVANRRFIIHYGQMVVAMFAGMGLLMPVSMLLGDLRIEAEALVMATWMVIGMAAWMAWRRHSWTAIVEMSLAMYLGFVVLFPAHWIGLLSAGGLMLMGHIIMLPAMALSMLRRREEYLAAH